MWRGVLLAGPLKLTGPRGQGRQLRCEFGILAGDTVELGLDR
jgi:hypothetical protein